MYGHSRHYTGLPYSSTTLFLKWLALRIDFSSPTNTEPIGAPNDLDKHNETLSKYEQYSLILIPVATLAFHNLARLNAI